MLGVEEDDKYKGLNKVGKAGVESEMSMKGDKIREVKSSKIMLKSTLFLLRAIGSY